MFDEENRSELNVRKRLIPLIYVLTLIVGIAYTFQISASPIMSIADICHLLLIIVVVGGLEKLADKELLERIRENVSRKRLQFTVERNIGKIIGLYH